MGQRPSLTHTSQHLQRRASIGVLNPLFEDVLVLRRRSHYAHPSSRSNQLIEAIVSNNFEVLLVTLDSLIEPGAGATEQELAAIKAELASFIDEERGWNVFHFAAHHQSDSIMEKLVEFLGDSEIVNDTSKDQGLTALHIIVRGETDNERLVSTLLNHPRINVNVKDGEKWTALHHLCQRGFPGAVLSLQTADFCCLNQEGDSPLHLAAANLHSNIFSRLAECESFKTRYRNNPCFTELKDATGNTLLHMAVDSANMHVVEWCFEFGFKVNSCNIHKMNCMHVAARRGDYNIAAKIIEQAKTEEVDLENFVNAPSSDRTTPFYIASKFGHMKIMELLHENGAYVNAKTAVHFTPLLAAIRYAHPGPVELLLEKGANVMVKDRLKYYNPIMWAVEIQSPQILKLLLVHVTKKNLHGIWKIVDLQNNTAHHIAAKAKNADMLKSLMEHNSSCLTEKNSSGLTPFHITVCEGKLSILNYIMSDYVNATYILDHNGSSGLHIAAEAGHADIVDRLLRVGSSDNTVGTCDNRGWTPIHLASKNGHLEALELLMQHSQRKHLEIVDNQHRTALYLACVEGRPKCVEFLIKGGALLTYSSSKNETESVVMSCLNGAIDADHNTVVAVILDSEKWQHALQYCYLADAVKHPTPKRLPVSRLTVARKHPETPLRKLIKKMPGEAKIVFDKCKRTETKVVEDERGRYYTEEVHYNYDFIEDFRDLFLDQGSKVLSEHYEGQDVSQSDAFPMRRRASVWMGTNQFSDGRDATVTRREGPESMQYYEQLEPTASPRKDERWGPEVYRYEDHPLHLMVLYKRQELLKHPLVASFIHQKWNLFGRWIYYPNVVFYTLLMLLLTIYMFLRFDYSKLLVDSYRKQMNLTLSISDCSENITLHSLSDASEGVVQQLQRDRNRLIVCSVFITLIRILMELYQIAHHVQEYFLDVTNYMEGILYVATIVFVTNFQLHCLPSWVWQLGALCIFLSWINFILFLSEQPVVGIYVVMFQDMIKTFLRLSPMAILLVLAFGQPFFMLLSVVEVETPPQQFLTFPYSLLKSFSMITGEIETDRIFFSTPSVITYPVITYFLWIIFLIIMPMLLQNLLVGLAVDDIKSVQEKAALKKEALQIAFILDIMNQLPKCVVKRWNKRSYTQTWGKGPVQKFWKWLNGSYWKPELRVDSTKEQKMGSNLDSVCEAIMNMEKRLQNQLNEQNAKLEKMMLVLSHEQKRL